MANQAEITDSYEDPRGTLLRHYEGQLRNHGWYLLTDALASFAGISASFLFAKANLAFAIIVLSLALGMGAIFGLYCFGRLLHFARSCYYIIRIKPKQSCKLTLEPCKGCELQPTRLLALDQAILDCLAVQHKWLERFFKGKLRELGMFIVLGTSISFILIVVQLIRWATLLPN